MKTQKSHPSAISFIAFSLIALLGIVLFTFSDNVAMAFVRRVTVYQVNGGTVAGTGINCGSDCIEDTESGVSFTLTATPDSGRTFVKWIPENICTGGATNASCSFTVDNEVYIQASWGYNDYTVSVAKEGDGAGTVTGIGMYHVGDTVTLHSTADSGSTFTGWVSGICNAGKGGGIETSPTCSFTISANSQTYSATAKFTKTASTTPSPAPTNKTNSSSTSASTDNAPAPTAETSSTPPISELKLNNDPLAAGTTPTLSEKEVILSGKTTPLATINLYVHSDPRLVTTTTDEQGFWSVTVSDLEAGDHSVEAEVIDPVTGTTSERQQIAAFSISPTTQTATNTSTAQRTMLSRWLWIALAVLVLAGLGIGGWLYWKKYKAGRATNNQTPTPPNISS